MRRFFSKLIVAVIFCLVAHYSNAQKIDNTRISIKVKDASLKEIIKIIEDATDFRFSGKAEDIERERRITVNEENIPLNKLLDKLLSGRGLTYKQVDKNILLKKEPANSKPAYENAAAKKFSLHGTIKSSKSGETIIGASILISNSSIATISNDYGFYSLTLPEGIYTVLVSAAAMQPAQLSINLDKNLQQDIQLEEAVKELEVVTVTSSPATRNLRTPQMSVERINVEEIKNVPVLFGEKDVLKTIQLLPGVKSAGEGNSGFYVRGGAADQNLILLDEAPVYNASHLLGFFSTFNSDAIKNVTMYKGGMPPQYGGRLSSVVDIKMNEGNNQDFGVNGGIGLISSRLNIEGPIQKDKSSFLVSGRRTYADLFLKLLGDSSLRSARLYFYDLNAKANIIVGEKDKLYLSGYFGRDVLSQEDLAGISWGNGTGTLRWNHIFNQKLFSNTSLIYSNYDYRINLNTESTDYQILSRIYDWNLKQDMQWFAGTAHTISFGLNAIYHTIRPGEISVTGSSGISSQGLEDRYSLDNAVYINDNWKLSPKWNVTAGLRLSSFTILGKGDYYTLDEKGEVTDTTHYKKGEVVKNYLNLEPRLGVSYQLNNSSSLKASYTRNSQNLHLISNSTSASPTDKWVASTNIIKPELADQFAVGYYKNLWDNRFELTVEAYYKSMQNQVDYRDGGEVFSNDPIETQLLFGKGRAYGIEWLFRKRAGRFNGWLSYTLSKTERKIAGVNSGKWYNARQDRTHDIAIVAMYQLSKKWSVAANWVFYTGDAVTYPEGKYTLNGEVYFEYSSRNGYRMPTYHRLDIGATVQLKKKKRFSSELNLSVFNAYGRANAYQINFRESKDDPDKTEAVKTSLFTFVPSVTYNFKF